MFLERLGELPRLVVVVVVLLLLLLLPVGVTMVLPTMMQRKQRQLIGRTVHPPSFCCLLGQGGVLYFMYVHDLASAGDFKMDGAKK